jgi:hypothetical protein
MNGQESGEEHLFRFQEWVNSKTDADFRDMARGANSHGRKYSRSVASALRLLPRRRHTRVGEW